MNALSQIRQIDYTVIFVRDMKAMQHFYQNVMEFPVQRTLGDRWIEYSVGSNTLALAAYGSLFNDTPPAQGALALQMAFRVAPDAVAACTAALEAKGVKLVLRSPIIPSAIARSSSAIPTAMSWRSSRKSDVGRSRARRHSSIF